jgi:hypothetical protein
MTTTTIVAWTEKWFLVAYFSFATNAGAALALELAAGSRVEDGGIVGGTCEKELNEHNLELVQGTRSSHQLTWNERSTVDAQANFVSVRLTPFSNVLRWPTAAGAAERNARVMSAYRWPKRQIAARRPLSYLNRLRSTRLCPTAHSNTHRKTEAIRCRRHSLNSISI